MKMGGYSHRLLSGSSIANQKDFLRLQKISEPLQFSNQHLINFQATGSVKNLDISCLRFGPFQSGSSNRQQIRFTRSGAKNWNSNLFRQRSELIDCGGPVQI